MRFFSAKCISAARLDNKTAIVTGSNTGIGKHTAQDLYIRGARVIMACRSREKVEAAVEEIKNNCQNLQNVGELIFVPIDLASLRSIRNCANHLLETEQNIALLINNAGIMVCPESRTEDGFEMQFGTNHLGHFLFTLLLLPKIIQSAPSRIINVSSKLHNKGDINFDDLYFTKRPYSAIQAYSDSKLANVLFTKELALRLQTASIKDVTVYSLHPGLIKTELGRHLDTTYFPGLRWILRIFFGVFMKTPEQGAQTSIYCAVDENAGKETGLYYSECHVDEPCAEANNANKAKKLWDDSWKLVELENFNPFYCKHN